MSSCLSLGCRHAHWAVLFMCVTRIVVKTCCVGDALHFFLHAAGPGYVLSVLDILWEVRNCGGGGGMLPLSISLHLGAHTGYVDTWMTSQHICRRMYCAREPVCIFLRWSPNLCLNFRSICLYASMCDYPCLFLSLSLSLSPKTPHHMVCALLVFSDWREGASYAL